MSLHKEIRFVDEICEHLGNHGWLYVPGDAQDYDRTRALFPADVVAWVQATQPKAWDALSKNHGPSAETVLLDRLRKSLDDRGTLDVLRNGVEMIGLRQPLSFAQFKPALAMNPETMGKYQANRLRVVREVYLSHGPERLDLVFFLNGIPVSTAELKTDFTQSVHDAIDQYRFDRNPKGKGKGGGIEPLLSFPCGALVHFAVSNMEVHMTTKLAGPKTSFLPFNKGDNGAAGNPVNPQGGHRSAYLWEEVLERESWLEIIGRYLITKRDNKKKVVGIIFPRYHQLAATRKLVQAILAEGPGGKYLFQHSAGSGKTNSIAWSAHFLADLHDENHLKLFDTVLVVSDRTVLDAQLQEAIFDFERTAGVVATISGEQGSKSGELAKALADGKKIVVCTIQTFPFALRAVQELAATEGKRFAVIADEAHSSQTGEAAAKLKAVLSAEELMELEDGGEVSTEDLLVAQMAARAADSGITYLAFTATPKAKTLELFGSRPDPTRKAAQDNLPAPFHVYTMRQAIGEGFILDVLKNYTPYSLAFKLAQDGKELDITRVEKSAALKGIMRWVRLHAYNISQRVQIVVEHFRENVAGLLDGQAKAMVVVSSRKEAVRWQVAIDKYIKAQKYPIGTLVAFSGEVKDPETGADPFTEKSTILNPNLRGRDIRDAFETGEYQILLVANKFQTGFDQPLLCGMYVDKRLSGIQAVQTLSRLNRSHPGKENVFIVDFVNLPQDILDAFKPYYGNAELENVTDPDMIFNLRSKLDAAGFYDDFEIDRVIEVYLNPASKQKDLTAAIEPVASRLLQQYKEARAARIAAEKKKDKAAAEQAKNALDALVLFKSDMQSFVRAYTFLSQIFDYGNTAIEKRAIFFRLLIPLLEYGRERDEIDLSKVILTHHNLKKHEQQSLVLEGGEKLKPMTEVGTGSVQDKEKALLREIIAQVNELFEGNLTEDDKLVYVNNVLKGKLMESEVLAQQAVSNTKEQFANSPDLANEILAAIMDALTAHTSMSTQALNSEKVRQGLQDVLLGPGNLYEALREKATAGPTL